MVNWFLNICPTSSILRILISWICKAMFSFQLTMYAWSFTNPDLNARLYQFPLFVHSEGCVVWKVVFSLDHQLTVCLSDNQWTHIGWIFFCEALSSSEKSAQSGNWSQRRSILMQAPNHHFTQSQHLQVWFNQSTSWGFDFRAHNASKKCWFCSRNISVQEEGSPSLQVNSSLEQTVTRVWCEAWSLVSQISLENISNQLINFMGGFDEAKIFKTLEKSYHFSQTRAPVHPPGDHASCHLINGGNCASIHSSWSTRQPPKAPVLIKSELQLTINCSRRAH